MLLNITDALFEETTHIKATNSAILTSTSGLVISTRKNDEHTKKNTEHATKKSVLISRGENGACNITPWY